MLSASGWVATGLGVGHLPVAPGTFGSALGVLVFLGLLRLPVTAYALTLLAVLGIGVWAAAATERATGRHDDRRIVIDEVAGQLLNLAPLLLLRPRGGASMAALLMTGFVLFRVLDIWKPGPVRWAERHFSGGTGIMADDVVAGALGALLLLALLLATRGTGWIEAASAASMAARMEVG
jgi:phosphatidylglycerophosphatase A